MNLHGIFALAFSLSLSALSLVPEKAELSPWLSPVLVLPVLQLLTCSGLTEALTDRRTHSLNQDLAHRLLHHISREMDKPRQVSQRLPVKNKHFFHGSAEMKRFWQGPRWPSQTNQNHICYSLTLWHTLSKCGKSFKRFELTQMWNCWFEMCSVSVTFYLHVKT